MGLVEWLATLFGFGDENSCGNHEFSSPRNSVFYYLPENPILLGQTF